MLYQLYNSIVLIIFVVIAHTVFFRILDRIFYIYDYEDTLDIAEEKVERAFYARLQIFFEAIAKWFR